METLSIEKFNPTKAELTALSKRYKNLKIKGVDDKAGYAAVDTARKELKQVRRNIQITGKEMRAEALKFQKEVIARENEYVEMIEPVEKALAEKQRVVDEERERIKRAELLPERRKQLEKYEIVADDDYLLGLDDAEFEAFANARISEVLEERERIILEKERKLAQEKQEAEEKKQREAELEEARKKATKEAEERAKREKEEAKQKAEQDKKDALAKAEKDKKDAIDKLKREQKEKEEKAERERIAAKAKKDQEEWEAKKEQERAEKNKKYKNWTNKNGVTADNKDDFTIVQSIEGVKIRFTLYKKIDTITI